MDRRTLFRIAAGAGTLIGGRGAAAATSSDAVPRVAYHLSDIEKVPFVLGNVTNHIDGMGGRDKVRIAIVVHGPPLRAFRADTPNVAVKTDTARLVQAGVALFACSHTLDAMQLSLKALVPGFAVAERGGVVKLADLQQQGWLYLRP